MKKAKIICCGKADLVDAILRVKPDAKPETASGGYVVFWLPLHTHADIMIVGNVLNGLGIEGVSAYIYQIADHETPNHWVSPEDMVIPSNLKTV